MTTGEPLPYELHVTVEAQDKPANFIATCRDLGVKAIILDLGVNVCGDLTDYMTSSRGLRESDTVAFAELDRTAQGLNDNGFEVIRRKIEAAPWHPNAPQEAGQTMPDGSYFESHLAVVCRPEEVAELREGILETAQDLPLHLSRNQFKPVDENGKIIMMATLRNPHLDFAAFSGVLEASQTRIQDLGFEIAKRAITEFSLFDSNVHQDDAWMSRN